MKVASDNASFKNGRYSSSRFSEKRHGRHWYRLYCSFFIEELGRRVKDGLSICGVPTSHQSKLMCTN